MFIYSPNVLNDKKLNKNQPTTCCSKNPINLKCHLQYTAIFLTI